MADLCPFCEIIAGRAPVNLVQAWGDTIAIVPIKPIVAGHVLVIPLKHVYDFADDKDVAAMTMRRAAEFARYQEYDACNIITSRGRAATQSVPHLHLHLVPRAVDDGLALPWYSGRRSARKREAGHA